MPIAFYNGQIIFSQTTGKIMFSPGNCCNTCCRHCLNNQSTRQIQVELTGALRNMGCADCASFAGVYILDWVRDCTWEYVFPLGTPCNYKRIRSNFGGVWNVQFLADDGAGEYTDAIFSEPLPGINCLTLVSQELTVQTGFDVHCSNETGLGSTARCFISAVLPP